MSDETTPSARQPVCMVCKRSMKTITNTHLKTHSLTKREYLQMFPNAFLGSCSWLSTWRNSEENKVHLQKQAVALHTDPVLHKKQQDALRKVRQQPYYREALSKAIKRYANSPEGRAKLSSRQPTLRMKMSNFQRWVVDYGLEVAIQKQLDWQRKNVLPSKSRNTKLELLVQDSLRLCGYDFVTQLVVPRYYCDIFVPKLNLIIEVNGDYWHANPEKYSENDIIGHKHVCASDIWKRDEKKILDLRAMGYNVAVIWESELKKLTHINLVEDIVRRYEKL